MEGGKPPRDCKLIHSARAATLRRSTEFVCPRVGTDVLGIPKIYDYCE